jgi:molybdate/tungstate transport system substrate-binding protein
MSEMAAVAACLTAFPALAEALSPLEVASAGSIGPMLNGPVRQAISGSLRLDLHLYAKGADAVAKAIVDQSIHADVFVPITAGPMRAVFRAGLATVARPIAQTEMVLVYSPKSRFAAEFEAAAQGRANWWEILQRPGFRLVRSNPAGDPGGRNVLFTMMLAAKKYGQPDLVEKVLGPTMNPAQILSGGDNRVRLQNGEIDAMASYKVGTSFESFPYLELPGDINLSGLSVRESHPDVSLRIGEQVFYPEPLVFYAGVLTGAANPGGAAAFVDWLCHPEGQALLRRYRFGSVEGVEDLHV